MPYRLDPRPAFDARVAIHLALTLILVWLSYVLIRPGDAVFRVSPAWAMFRRFASEDQWAMMMLAGAMAGASGLATNYRWLKISSILLLATAHGTLALLFLIGNPTGWECGTYGTIAFLGYYLVARLVQSSDL